MTLPAAPGSVVHLMKEIFGTLKYIANHPLSDGYRFQAMKRYFHWQVKSRIRRKPLIVDFVNQSKLCVQRGITGATGNIYTGLHEFADMSFLLHFLGEGDTFVDVGANVGSYTILASAARKARSISIEPIPETFTHLVRNIVVNRIEHLVLALNIGLGAERGTLKFTSGLDTVNHVLTANESAVSDTTDVDVFTLDEITLPTRPKLIKIDVEGFETEVLKGGGRLLSGNSLLAAVIELNGSGKRYGFDESLVHSRMRDCGFVACTYQPFERRLTPMETTNDRGDNTLYVRNLPAVREALQHSPPFHVNGRLV